MIHKIVFSLLLFACFLSNSAISQNIDSTKIKYDKFVDDTKARSKDKYTYSQFAISIRYKDSLRLNSEQIDLLYKEISLLKTKKNDYYKIHKSSLDTRSYESQRVSEILTTDQHDLMLRLKNHSKAISITESDWKELEIRKLDVDLNQAATMIELYEYYIKRESIYDKFRHDPIKQNKDAREHYLTRPNALKLLTKSRKSDKNNTLGKQLNGN